MDLSVSQLQTQFPFLSAVVDESMRLASHSLGSVRTVKEEPFNFITSTGAEYSVPVGSLIFTSPQSLSMDSKTFSDPSQFDPERMLAPRQEAKGSPISFTPFSHGVHGCPGKPFALLMIQFVVLALVCQYDIEASVPLPRLDFRKATVAQRAKPVLLRWKKN